MSEAIAEAPGGPAEAAEQGDPLAGGEGAGAAVDAAPEPVAPAEPQIDPRELQAEIEFLRDQNAQIVEHLRSQGATPAQAQAQATQATGFDPASLVDEYGNLDPSAFAQFLANDRQQTLAEIRREIAGIAAPLAAREEAETLAEGEQRLNDILADDIGRNGEFVQGVSDEAKAADKAARAMVRTLANQAFPEVAQRYGMSPRAAEVAMTQAASQVRNLLKAAGATSVTQHVNHAATLAGVNGEPGTGAGSGIVTLGEMPANPAQIGATLVSKYSSRNRDAGSLY